MTKYIFVTGGVVSSLGKGITASALGQLLKRRGYKVFMQKFEPYINVDPGTMSPYQHGEIFVTKDGGQTDLDLGHYERFIDESLTRHANITAGQIYQAVIEKERRGEYNGGTVQVIPHITDEIKARIYLAADESGADIVITEVGGTVGDIESLPFLEAIRQVRREVGFDHTCYIHTTLVPYLHAAGEIKTKPTQHSVKELRSLGIHPDVIVLRTEVPIYNGIRDKIALFCDVNKEAVIECRDMEILYETVLALHEEGFDRYVCQHLKLKDEPVDLSDWQQLIHTIKNLRKEVTIGLVGKYVQLQDAYISVHEALKHAGYAHGAKVHLKWIDAVSATEDSIRDALNGVDGVIIPGGFGQSGIEGKMHAIRFAREKGIPFFGICLGMQLAAIEFARHVLGWKEANSTEFDENTPYPIVTSITGDQALENGIRLGEYPCELKEKTKAFQAYGEKVIYERHRNRYELNSRYKETLEKSGLLISGINPESGFAEIIELQDHPWFVATQFHPEFTSRPMRPNPLFRDFIGAALLYQNGEKRS
ncbi:MAG TPA: CTP synthase [Haloplasmataceae bacterium]